MSMFLFCIEFCVSIPRSKDALFYSKLLYMIYIAFCASDLDISIYVYYVLITMYMLHIFQYFIYLYVLRE